MGIPWEDNRLEVNEFSTTITVVHFLLDPVTTDSKDDTSFNW